MTPRGVVPLVLAAGQSSRMQRPKASLPFGDTTALGLILSVCRAVGLARPTVVAGADPDAVTTAAGDSAHVVTNPSWKRGRSTSIQAGLAALNHPDAVLLWPVDVCLPGASVVEALLARALTHPGRLAWVPSHSGRRGHPLLIAPAACSRFLALAPDAPARDVVRALHAEGALDHVDVEDETVLMNMNTPQDYAEALAQYESRLRSAPPGGIIGDVSGNGSNGYSGAPLRESCGALKHYWYVGCKADELGRKRPLGRLILGEAIVIYRDDAGRPVALLDRCLHRNAMLSEGFIDEQNCLVCPYHGWRYDPQGACVKVPSARQETPLPKKKLPAFPTLEQDGLIWVYMGDPNDIRCQPFRMPHWDEPGWKADHMLTMFDNDVTNCVENFMDVPHTVTVHDKWFRSTTRREVAATVERTEDSVLVTYHQEQDEIGMSQLILNPTKEPMKHTDKFYMPNVTRVDYDFGSKRSFVITSQCTPETPHRTRVYTLISFRLGNRLLNRIGRFVLPPYTRKVIQQDVEIMANQGASLRRYGEEFMNTEADLLHRYIESLRNWAERGGEDATRPKPAKEEILFYV